MSSVSAKSRAPLVALVALLAEGLGIRLLPQLVIDAGAVRAQAIALTPLEGVWPCAVILAWRKVPARAAEFEGLAAVLRAAGRGWWYDVCFE